MSGHGSGNGRKAPLSDRALWRRSRATVAPGDEATLFLDLAGFVENRLDPEDQARIAEILAGDPDLANDIAAARELTATPVTEAAPEAIVARAVALVGDGGRSGVVVHLAERRRADRLHGLARWASLAAAVAVAGWLGFTLGVDTSQSFTPPRAQITAPAAEDGVLHELLDPSAGFLRDLTGGTQA